MAKKDRDDKREETKEAGGMVGGAFAGGAVGGVAGGAMAGAAAGGLGGPAGAAIGAAVGAVAGALGGKAIANRINPEVEDEHWRTTYSTQPYVAKGATYDDYGPAYKLGYERYPDYHGRSWEEAEPHLQRDWETGRGKSRLEWNDARHATRDAFNRTRTSISRDDDTVGTMSGTSTTGAYGGTTVTGDTMLGSNRDEVIDDLNKLLRGELAATETYRQALDKMGDKYGHDASFQQLAQMHRDHQEAVGDLRNLIQQMGGNPSNDSGAWGTWSNTVMGAARVLGDKSALSALVSGERSGLDDYQDVLKNNRTPDQVRHVFRTRMQRNQEHIQRLEQMIAAT
jgi:bacterioferritin (cytochrome b1)